MGGERSFQFDGVKIELCHEDGIQLLKIVGFRTEQAAEAFMPRVRTGFAFLLLNRGMAVNAEFELQKVHMADDPKQAAENLSKDFGGANLGGQVDGVLDGRRPAIYRSHGNFRRITAGSMSVLVTTHAADIAASIEHGMRAANPAALVDDPRLQTAMELYGAAQTESTGRARFITLMMVLEALAEPTRRPAAVQSFLDSVQEMLTVQRSEYGDTSEEAFAFEALQREIFFRRDDSIRSQVRQLVLKTLADEDAAKRAVGLYDQRSTLVHKGALPEQVLGEATTAAMDLTRRVLAVRYTDTVGLPAPATERGS
jgi:hypothetical protein